MSGFDCPLCCSTSNGCTSARCRVMFGEAQQSLSLSLRALQREAFQTAVDKGWWDDQMVDEMEDSSRSISYAVSPKLAEETIPEKLALIHSEVSEALEDYRNGKMVTTTRTDSKPEGFPSELVDIIIRVFDLAGALKLDLQDEIEKKMAYNKTRTRRHGNKRC